MTRRPGTTPPPDASAPRRHPDAPAAGTAIGTHYPLCFGCGMDHPAGLRMMVRAGDDVATVAELEVGATTRVRPAGARRPARGGARRGDGVVNSLLQQPAVTARLDTDSAAAVPVGTTLHLRARRSGVAGRRVYLDAEGRLGDPTGELAVTAAAVFVPVPLAHFAAHGRPAEVVAAAAERRFRRGPLLRSEPVTRAGLVRGSTTGYRCRPTPTPATPARTCTRRSTLCGAGRAGPLPTGIAIALPGRLRGVRSSSVRTGGHLRVSLVNAPGTVDAGYRGDQGVRGEPGPARAGQSSAGATASPSSWCSGWRRPASTRSSRCPARRGRRRVRVHRRRERPRRSRAGSGQPGKE